MASSIIITGPTGSGKSSVDVSLRYALFRERPDWPNADYFTTAETPNGLVVTFCGPMLGKRGHLLFTPGVERRSGRGEWRTPPAETDVLVVTHCPNTLPWSVEKYLLVLARMSKAIEYVIDPRIEAGGVSAWTQHRQMRAHIFSNKQGAVQRKNPKVKRLLRLQKPRCLPKAAIVREIAVSWGFGSRRVQFQPLHRLYTKHYKHLLNPVHRERLDV